MSVEVFGGLWLKKLPDTPQKLCRFPSWPAAALTLINHEEMGPCGFVHVNLISTRESSTMLPLCREIPDLVYYCDTNNYVAVLVRGY